MTTPIEQMSFKPTGATVAKTLGDHTAEIINAKDYGAVGNGATDDTDAIQAAFNAAFGMSMFQGSINGSTGVLTVSGATTIAGNARPKSFAPIVAGSVLVFPDVPLKPPNFAFPTQLTIAAFGTGGTTGVGGTGTYQLVSSGGNFNTQTSQPMLTCNASQQTFHTRPVRIPTGNYWIYSALYVLAVVGAHIFGDGNGSTQLLYLGDGTQGNLLINAGATSNQRWTPVIALDGVAYSKIEGISFSSYPGTQSEQGALPIATRLTGSITGDVLTVTAGPYDGKIVAGMTLSYALFGVGQSPVGLTILAFGTGGTTGTGLTGTYKLSSTPGLTDPDMTATSVVPRMTGIMAYQSSILGTTSAIHFENLNISNMYAGIAAVQGLGNVENCILLNVAFATCGLRGLWLTNQNVLNWQVYGGGCSNSGWLSTFDNASGTGDPGGAYYAGTGSIGCIYGVSTTGNNWDIIAGQQCHVAGGSSEGGPAIPLYGGTITWSSAAGGTARWTGNLPHKMQMDQPIAILQCSVAGYNGRFTGHRVDAYTFTYPLAVNPVATGTDGYIVPTNSGTVLCVGNTMSIDGFAFRGGSSLYILPIYCAGYAVMKGCSFNCGNDGGQGIIAWLSNGYLDLNGTNIITYDSSTFKAVGNSELRMRGTNWIGRPANPFVLFAGGVVSEYDQIQRTTVANLPTASSIFTGLRGSVTDLNIARAYGGSVVGHGGGSTFCDVVCTGSDWIMA